jgi:carboxylate-amine ligase
MKLLFKENTESLTLGAELEFQVLDNETLQLTPRANEIIESLKSKKVIREFFQSTLEVITDVCNDTHEIKNDFLQSLSEIKKVSDKLNIKLASTGTHPMADYRDRLVTDFARYHELVDRNQWLVLRRAVYGMHIHIGMRSGDECISFNNFFLHFTPHLVALSASSPYWQKYDTGLAACRLTMYEAMPTAGIPYVVKNWREFQKLVKFLMRSDSIRSMKDLWWDLRPSPAIGTLELRMCDTPATFSESIAIIAFVHALAHWYNDNHQEWLGTNPSLKRWIYRENKWRAIRYGLQASIIVTREGHTKLLADDLNEWIEKLAPQIKRLGYEAYFETIRQIILKGNSAERQRKIFEQTNELNEVVKFNNKEFEKGVPIWLN